MLVESATVLVLVKNQRSLPDVRLPHRKANLVIVGQTLPGSGYGAPLAGYTFNREVEMSESCLP